MLKVLWNDDWKNIDECQNFSFLDHFKTVKVGPDFVCVLVNSVTNPNDA